MVPFQVESDDVSAYEFHQDNESQNDACWQDGDGEEGGAGAYGVIDDARSCVLVGGEDGAFVVVDSSFFVHVFGHEGGDVGAGEAGDEGEACDAGDAHEEVEEGLEEFACGSHGAQVFTDFYKSLGYHGNGHHGEGEGEAFSGAEAAGAQHGYFRAVSVAELAHEAHEVESFQEVVLVSEDAGEADDQKEQGDPAFPCDFVGVLWFIFVHMIHSFSLQFP